MIQETAPAVEDDEYRETIARHQARLAQLHANLPRYGSVAYWHIVEELDRRVALPLEVIVKCIRVASAYGDDAGRNRTLEILFRRIAYSNEHWAHSVLRTARLSESEQALLAHDLYADICEGVIRAIMDPTRLFWEENFLHCLSFERKHVYHAFMRREGRWYSIRRRAFLPLVEDEVARKALLAVEQSDLFALIVGLPEKLKAVVLLIFWEERTEKDVAQILGITDRTVRNRLKHALHLLYQKLEPERDMFYG